MKKVTTYSITALAVLGAALLLTNGSSRQSTEATQDVYKETVSAIRTSDRQVDPEEFITSTRATPMRTLERSITQDRVKDLDATITVVIDGEKTEYAIREVPEHMNAQMHIDDSTAVVLGTLKYSDDYIGIYSNTDKDEVNSFNLDIDGASVSLDIRDVAYVSNAAVDARFSGSGKSVYEVTSKINNNNEIIIQYGDYVYLTEVAA